MRAKETDDIELKNEIRKQLKANDGYCPCKIDDIPENIRNDIEFIKVKNYMEVYKELFGEK